jgi:hypothetical protein
LFLENVKALATGPGLDAAMAQLNAAGYAAWWACVPAHAVGSPQVRTRWFCLAVRPAAFGRVLRNFGKSEPFDWGREPVARMVPPAGRTDIKRRAGMLGNAVVPDAARLAFLMLWTGLRASAPEALAATEWVLAPPEALGALGADRAQGAALLDTAKGKVAVAAPRGLAPKPSLGIVVFAGAHQRPAGGARREVTSPRVDTLKISQWPTPRTSTNAFLPSQTLTLRTARDLSTALRFARCTPAAQRGGHVNPEWLEWLMGFPRGWTLASSKPGPLKTRTPKL